MPAVHADRIRLLGSAFGAAAHDIPADVKVNAFVKPTGKQLELLMRVPLAADARR